MANYYRNFIKLMVPGLTVGSGAVVLCYNLLYDDKHRAYAATPVHTDTYSPKWDSNWDRRDPGSLMRKKKGLNEADIENHEDFKKFVPKATRHLFLIRHGQYNLDGLTDKERKLTDLGRAQAEFTGIRLKELNYPYTGLYKSTMTRAQETANIIFQCLPAVNFQTVADCNMLEEGPPVPPDPPLGHWKPEKHFYEHGARIEAAFRKYIHRAHASQIEDSYDIIVCHANVIRYFVCRALQLPPEAWLRFILHHSSITWLVIGPNGRVSVRCIGDSGHMPPDAITSK